MPAGAWLPRWLASQYAKLYSELGNEEFSFEEALSILQSNQEWARMVVSTLRRRGFLDVLGREGRRRIYKLAEPREAIVLLGKGIDLLKAPEAARPLLRPYLSGLFQRLKHRVVSVAIYGSFARGDYRDNSDIDLLLVIRDFNWNESLTVDRADELAHRLWKLKQVYHSIQPYPLTPEQASIHRPIYLDMIEDAIVLYDEKSFIANVFKEMKRKLITLGAVRHKLPNGSWYWDLKPRIREGEIIEV